ncbi:hypothetical protein [Streptomyces sp. NPDC051016]|uniref:hypothetical protein n=1 Tax=Streptomyces sp. NPDC051016 TaxID=3365638 RepID=UPI0037B2866E
MPSKGLASLHRALATETAAGRRVVAVSGEPMRDQSLIDPQTYRIVGMRMVRGGKVVGGDSTVARVVVDKAGDRG